MKHIKDIKNKLDWEKYYNPNFNWHSVQLYSENILSEDFIREFKDKVNWYYISEFQKLSENFIREFKNDVSWVDISMAQVLSEDFIREFKDKVDWSYISDRQRLSKDFKEEFKEEFKKVLCMV